MHLLTPADLEHFHRDGYTIVRGLFSPTEVAQMRAAFERLARTAQELPEAGLHRGTQFVITPGEPVRIHRIVWCAAAEPILSAYGMDPRLLRLAGQVLGVDTLEQLINQAHFKLPGDEVSFPWHQDSTHRGYGTPDWTDVDGRGSFLEIATALDPVGESNGPLRFIRGSHTWGHVSSPDGTIPAGTFDPADAVTPELDPGDAVLFGPYLIHGSEPNRATRPRRTFLNGFAVPGANRRIYPGEGSGRRLRVPPPDARPVYRAGERPDGSASRD